MGKKKGAPKRSLSQRLQSRLSNRDRAWLTKLQGCERWPIEASYINESWEESGLAHVLLARRRPDGMMAMATFLVDMGCLGVKDVDLNPRQSPQTIQEMVLASEEFGNSMLPCSAELVAKLVHGGVAWAQKLGFEPANGFLAAQKLLEGLDPAACDTPVEFGRDGKPYYMAGPYDNVAQVIAKLQKVVGEDFELMTPADLVD